MRIVFCTIITADFIHYALTLYSSLLKFKPNTNFYILVSDTNSSFDELRANFPLLHIIYDNEICKDKISIEIRDKYKESDMDCFRWSMKSLLIKYLLGLNYEQVFFLDPDTYFFNSFDFLFDELDNQSVLLTPHWRSANPYMDPKNFAILQTSGLFNAGFIGATKAGIPAMEWWSLVCEYECKKEPSKGLFVDQSYLDLMPIYFEDIKILRHRGCNIASWNQAECPRTLTEEGKVYINGIWEIVFIHFTKSTIKGILSGKDTLLRNHLAEYQDSLEKFSVWIPQDSLILKSVNNKWKEKFHFLWEKALHQLQKSSEKVKRIVS